MNVHRERFLQFYASYGLPYNVKTGECSLSVSSLQVSSVRKGPSQVFVRLLT